jgi:hypothetical protein
MCVLSGASTENPARDHGRGRVAANEEAMSEWQPIETAPTDGTWVLVWGPSQRWSSVMMAWFALNHRSGKAYWKDSTEWDDYELVDDQPTHWMPLPEPPK